jgi:hypothetical protein
MKMAAAAGIALLLCGCASTAPISIGGGTYYASKKNTAGMFGDVNAMAGKLMTEGNSFCASRGGEFQLLTTSTSPDAPMHFGSASITFKCPVHAGSLSGSQ